MSVRFAVDRRALSLVATLMCCLLAGALAFASAPASAKEAFVPTLGSASFSQPGAVEVPGGVAVDPETGNVYVVDLATGVVQIFGAEGGSPSAGVPAQITGASAIEPWGIAVDASCWYHEPRLTGSACESYDPANGNVYVGGHTGVVDEFHLDPLTGAYELAHEIKVGGEPEGVAVDHDGDLYVANYKDTPIVVYDALGAKLGEIEINRSPTIENPGYIAVGAPGVVYVGNKGGGAVKLEVGPSYEITHEAPIGGEESSALAVDSKGDVFVDDRYYVSYYNSAAELIEEFAQGLKLSAGIAVDDATGDVYVSNLEGNDVLVFKPGIIPDVTPGPVQSFTTSTATLTGAVDPNGTTVTGCEFEYVSASKFKEREEGKELGFATPGVLTVPCEHPDAAEIPADSEAHAVSATATGLIQGETYYYRLSASNAGGTDHSIEAKFLQPETVVVEGESSSFVEAGAATLEAKINPGGSETAYHFEYGPAAGVYDVSVPVPDREIAAGLSGVEVSARATGLMPGTTYHYRVVAANGLPGVVAGPDQTFTTLTPQGTGSPANCKNEQLRVEQPYGLQLPDCRAYELVSPVDKEGAELEAGLGLAAGSGDAAAYSSQTVFDKPSGESLINWYLSRRGQSGWTTQNITPPDSVNIEPNIFPAFVERLFTPELTAGVFYQLNSTLSTEVPPGYDDLFRADFAEGSYQTVTNVPPPGEAPYSENYNVGPLVGGASADLSHIAFDQHAGLTPGASSGKEHAYVWVQGTLHQVDIPPAGTTFTGEDGVGAQYFFYSQSPYNRWHAVSENGLRIVFTAGSNGQVYVRENPEREQSPENGGKCTVSSDACTVEVSASERRTADPHGPRPASFQGASANGSRVFFTSDAELTETANTGEADNAPNLYEYDFEKPEGERLTDLTVDTEPADVKDGAKVDGVADIGEDGSYVYFVAEGKLASNENAHHATAEAGKPNLYVYHEGAVTFIATLSPNDSYGEVVGDRFHGSRVSADGTHLAFMSERDLAGYDNQPLTPNSECGPEGCPEIYLYDASSSSSGSLVCASCDPSGARPVQLAASFQYNGFLDGESLVPPRNLSEDGARLFFDSRESLLPQASNGLENVYEYEDGHLYLISDGSGAYSSTFMEASASGNDVFFTTADGLLPQARDKRTNVYDARVEGGFPVVASAPTCDNADSCHGQESPQPAVFGAPASATFGGAGNLAPLSPAVVVEKVTKKTVKCEKGFTKSKKSKCVRKKKKTKAKKSTNGKGSK